MTKTVNFKNSVIHSFPGIGEFTSQTIKAYEEAGWLAKMLTTIVIHSDKKWVKVLNKNLPKIGKRFKNRNFQEIPPQKIKLYPYKELFRLFAVRFLSLVSADKIWEWAEISYDKWAARQLNSEIKVIHAYEHAALASFEKASKLGIFKILEQTSQHYNYYEALVKEQFSKYPELKSAYNEHISGSLFVKRKERKRKEHELADLIICNSTFTKKSLVDAKINAEKIVVVPLAFPECVENIGHKKVSGVFTFLYAGSLSVGKGTHLLLDIWRTNFGDNYNLKLVLVGKNLLPDSMIKNLSPNIEMMDYVSHKTLTQLYDRSDAFVFPTLGDGFGMVITEAMARGLPVIASKNSAGPDLITDLHDGLLIDAGSQKDLLTKMIWCIENRSELNTMAERVLQKAQTYQWGDYRKKLIKEISSKIDA